MRWKLWSEVLWCDRVWINWRNGKWNTFGEISFLSAMSTDYTEPNPSDNHVAKSSTLCYEKHLFSVKNRKFSITNAVNVDRNSHLFKCDPRCAMKNATDPPTDCKRFFFLFGRENSSQFPQLVWRPPFSAILPGFFYHASLWNFNDFNRLFRLHEKRAEWRKTLAEH